MKRIFLFTLLSLYSLLIPASATMRQPVNMPSPAQIADRAQFQANMQQRIMSRANQWPVQDRVQNNTWQYWSMGIGAGAGLLMFPGLTEQTSSIPFPDFRIGIERSWYLNDQFTAMLDFSLFTPAMRLGYLVNDSTRVFAGISLWLIGSYGLKMFFSTLDRTRMAGGNVAVKDAKKFEMKSHLIVSPSCGIDHFISKNCFLRIMASYDSVRFAIDNDRTFTLHWPQITAALNFKF